MNNLVKKYSTYGKGDNPQIENQYIIEDTQENRQKLVDNPIGESYDSEDFINYKSNKFYFEKDCYDFDEATGGYVEIVTYDEEYKKLKNEYDKNMENLNKLFKMEKENE